MALENAPQLTDEVVVAGPAESPDEEKAEKSKAYLAAMLEEAVERYDRAWDDDKENRDNHREDFHFIYTPGKQWTDDIRAQRTKWKEPCLEYNQLIQFVHQVVNDQRQNRPGIRVHPAGGDASKDVAVILQGMARSIEYGSSAEAVYDTAYEASVVGGRGWWRLVTEYESGKTFNQKIVIKAIRDATSVVADMQYQEPDGSDRNFAFVLEPMTKKEFMRQWPDAEAIDWDKIPANWANADDIMVADYYRRVAKKRVLVAMSDGAIGWLDEMPTPPEGITERARRDVDVYTVEWYKIAGGQQVLAEYECPGEIIPVISTTGDEALLDGRRIHQGLIRHARDPQRMLNYGMTQQAVHLALTPRSPFVAAAGQISEFLDVWKNANREAYAYLPYTPLTVEGNLVPPPQRTAPSAPDAGWLNWTQQQMQMIKSTIGMYENSLGQRSTEHSGRAIIARERQGDNSTFHFADNLARAIALTGKIIINWVPVYYDKQRIVHTVGIDGTRKQVVINQASPDPQDPMRAIMLNDVTSGEYAVTVETGPSYATKRQESADKLGELVKAFPPMMQLAGDIVVRAQDIPDADALADRLKLALPPAVQQALAAEEKGQKAPDPQVMQAMAQKDGQIQQMQQALQQASQEVTQLKSGVAEKLQLAEMNARQKEKDAEHAQQLTFAKLTAERDARIAEASASGDLEVRLALIKQQTELRRAVIARATALQVAVLANENNVQLAQISADAESEAARAEAIDIKSNQGADA